MEEDYKRGSTMGSESREDIKRDVESNGLICDCGEKVYEVGKGTIESQPNYNKYFDYLECPKCKKIYYL
jgi:uncharacterized protein with PIN domain